MWSSIFIYSVVFFGRHILKIIEVANGGYYYVLFTNEDSCGAALCTNGQSVSGLDIWFLLSLLWCTIGFVRECGGVLNEPKRRPDLSLILVAGSESSSTTRIIEIGIANYFLGKTMCEVQSASGDQPVHPHISGKTNLRMGNSIYINLLFHREFLWE